MKKLVTMAVLSAALVFAGSNQKRAIRSAAQSASYSTPMAQLFGAPNDDYTYRAIHDVAATYWGTPRPVEVVRSVRYNASSDEAVVAMQAKWPAITERDGSRRIALEQIRTYRVTRQNGVWSPELLKLQNIIHTDTPSQPRS